MEQGPAKRNNSNVLVDLIHHTDLLIFLGYIILVNAHRHDVGERASQVKLTGPRALYADRR
jgi:hypothetical protein